MEERGGGENEPGGKHWRALNLTQADEQVEDVRVVVEDGALLNVGVELSLTLSVEALVEVRLEGVEEVLAQDDHLGGQDDVFRPT